MNQKPREKPIATPRPIGVLIRSRRRELDISQKEMATHLEVSTQFICHLEQGLTSLSYGHIPKVVELLRIDPKVLADKILESSRIYENYRRTIESIERGELS